MCEAEAVQAARIGTRRDLAVMFPGQGSQSKGMGRALFAAFPQQTRRASEVLGYSIERLCLEDPDKQLNDTVYTQPALYVVSALGFLRKRIDGDPAAEAEYALGHSLGEYNALQAAGVFDFETGLRLVAKRGEIMGRVRDGAMAAVLQIDAARVREFLDGEGLHGVDLANYNTPTQTVVSGRKDDIERALAALQRAGIAAIALKVGGAFHSRYMREATEEFATFAHGLDYATPRRTVIANSDAVPYGADDVAKRLAAQIATPVRWLDSVRYLIDRGVSEFVEINGTILGRMVAEIRSAPPR
ncbi:ACP S-malonyltransferase [Xanthomonas arboricola]|uniref:ACP S-malonyltransferase n=1 Tax=Xanthomonas arboricola TaxID=56448 RepID=UPI000C860AA8|nr:ACP S-malonyltransferase [Xanthomonas arboricola]